MPQTSLAPIVGAAVQGPAGISAGADEVAAQKRYARFFSDLEDGLEAYAEEQRENRKLHGPNVFIPQIPAIQTPEFMVRTANISDNDERIAYYIQQFQRRPILLERTQQVWGNYDRGVWKMFNSTRDVVHLSQIFSQQCGQMSRLGDFRTLQDMIIAMREAEYRLERFFRSGAVERVTTDRDISWARGTDDHWSQVAQRAGIVLPPFVEQVAPPPAAPASLPLVLK